MKKLLFLACLLSAITTKAQNLDEVIQFIKNNPKKASIYLIEDGKTTLSRNSNQLMPLASAAKTIVAIEFAQQAAKKKFSPNKKIAVAALEKYYLPNTDGGAFVEWLKSINAKRSDSVTLLQVAQGMIRFSSNASTEYLQDFLGLANINKNLTKLGLKNHQPLYYFTASALMVSLKPTDMPAKEWIDALKAMSPATYRKKTEEAHAKLKTDPDFIKTYKNTNLPYAAEKLWSDRLVASTTETYAKLMEKIGNHAYFDPTTDAILRSIMEWPMAYAGNKAVFKHLGQKGGSTGFILTDAFYGESKKGNTLACAFFFNDLTTAENKMIDKNFGAFEASIITDQTFRKKLAKDLK